MERRSEFSLMMRRAQQAKLDGNWSEARRLLALCIEISEKIKQEEI